MKLLVLVVQVKPPDQENLGTMVELWFTFSLIWSVCASVDENGRQRMDAFLREKDGTFPVKVVCRPFHVVVHVEEAGGGGALDTSNLPPTLAGHRLRVLRGQQEEDVGGGGGQAAQGVALQRQVGIYG